MPFESAVHTTIFLFLMLLLGLLAVVVLMLMSIVVSPQLSPTPGTESSLMRIVKPTLRAFSAVSKWLRLLKPRSTVGAKERIILVFGSAFITNHCRTLCSFSVHPRLQSSFSAFRPSSAYPEITLTRACVSSAILMTCTLPTSCLRFSGPPPPPP